jgi:hypothetical protein
MSLRNAAEWLEIWTTIIVNLTAIFTGLIVAGRWAFQRIEPTMRVVGRSALVGLIGSILFVIVAGLIAGSELSLTVQKLFGR